MVETDSLGASRRVALVRSPVERAARRAGGIRRAFLTVLARCSTAHLAGRSVDWRHRAAFHARPLRDAAAGDERELRLDAGPIAPERVANRLLELAVVQAVGQVGQLL